MESHEEQLLIKRIKADPRQFGLLYDQFYPRIFNYIFRRTSDFDAAKDITAETFLKAFLGIHKFKWRGVSLLNWLYRIATNEVNLYYRDTKYREHAISNAMADQSSEPQHFDLEKEKHQAQLELEKHEQFLSIQSALQKLPSHYQEVISLKYFEQLKIREISNILNKKEGTIKSLISRGLEKLRNQMLQPFN